MENNEKITNLVDKFINQVNKTLLEDIVQESAGNMIGFKCDYEIDNDLYRFLFKLGEILGNEDLKTMFKYEKTIEEIVAELEDNTCLSDFEELEEVEDTIGANSDSKYVYINEIVKHIPTGKFYQFSTQKSGDEYGKPEFMGEVIQKQITTTHWVNK
jgi:hypothetical protein